MNCTFLLQRCSKAMDSNQLEQTNITKLLENIEPKYKSLVFGYIKEQKRNIPKSLIEYIIIYYDTRVWCKWGNKMSINKYIVSSKLYSDTTVYGNQLTNINGKYEWKVRLRELNNYLGTHTCIGITSTTENCDDKCFGSSGDEYNYAYSTSGYKTSHLGAWIKYGSKAIENDVITVYLDLDNKQIGFSINDKELGLAYNDNDIELESYRLAVWIRYGSVEFISYKHIK